MVEARAALAAAERVEAKAELSVLLDELTMVAIADDLITQAAELGVRTHR